MRTNVRERAAGRARECRHSGSPVRTRPAQSRTGWPTPRRVCFARPKGRAIEGSRPGRGVLNDHEEGWEERDHAERSGRAAAPRGQANEASAVAAGAREVAPRARVGIVVEGEPVCASSSTSPGCAVNPGGAYETDTVSQEALVPEGRRVELGWAWVELTFACERIAASAAPIERTFLAPPGARSWATVEGGGPATILPLDAGAKRCASSPSRR